jgi:hypothetical protein
MVLYLSDTNIAYFNWPAVNATGGLPIPTSRRYTEERSYIRAGAAGKTRSASLMACAA